MTVSAQTTVNSSTGNGVTTVFPYTFKILTAADLEVLVDGVVKSLTADYTVSGAGTSGGGDVTFLSAPANGAIVVRRRNMQFLRAADYQYQGDLPNTVLNPDLDAPILMAQQLQEQIGRSLRGPAGETWAELSAAADRLDLFPVFDATTGALELSTFTQTQVASAVAAAYAAGSTADAVTFLQDGTGAVSRSVQSKLRDTVSIMDFGAVGDGVTDDTTAIDDFFSAASGKICILPAGTYDAASLITIASISGASFIGVPGQTKITGDFGYALLAFTALTDVSFYGITFESTYTNATISSNTAVVYGVSWRDVSFDRCEFTSPNANTQGLVVFARTNSGDTGGIIDGLWVENCKFEDIGQTAITLMNRGTASDKYQAARRVYIRNNYASGLGINNSFGMFVSLDGYGSEFEISGNSIEDGYLTLIENTGWWHGEIKGNRFRANAAHTKKWRAMVLDGASYGGIQNVTVADNKIEGDAPIGSYAWDCTYCDFHGNVWTFTEAAFGFDEAFRLVDCNYNTFTGEVYKSDDLYALRLMVDNGNCKYNQFVNCIADTSASAANTAVINFDGANTTNNEWDGYMVKGTGGSTWTQTTSAANNLAGYDEVGTWTPGLTFATPGDVAVTLTSSGRYTRQGRLVTVTFEIDTSVFTHTTASGALHITGLPAGITPSTTTLYYGAVGAFRGITKANFTQFSLRTNNGATYLGIYASGSAQTPASLSASDMPTGGTVALYGTITYEIA